MAAASIADVSEHCSGMDDAISHDVKTFFVGQTVTGWRGTQTILLRGPAGCGKSTQAALITEAAGNCIPSFSNSVPVILRSSDIQSIAQLKTSFKRNSIIVYEEIKNIRQRPDAAICGDELMRQMESNDKPRLIIIIAYPDELPFLASWNEGIPRRLSLVVDLVPPTPTKVAKAFHAFLRDPSNVQAESATIHVSKHVTAKSIEAIPEFDDLAAKLNYGIAKLIFPLICGEAILNHRGRITVDCIRTIIEKVAANLTQ